MTTKHGTKMVLSVSKTFLKLKDLILEKKTLEEQMTKMKHVNETLCSQVNLHEEKLCGITGTSPIFKGLKEHLLSFAVSL